MYQLKGSIVQAIPDEARHQDANEESSEIKRLENENADLLEEVRQLRAAIALYSAVIERQQTHKRA